MDLPAPWAISSSSGGSRPHERASHDCQRDARHVGHDLALANAVNRRQARVRRCRLLSGRGTNPFRHRGPCGSTAAHDVLRAVHARLNTAEANAGLPTLVDRRPATRVASLWAPSRRQSLCASLSHGISAAPSSSTPFASRARHRPRFGSSLLQRTHVETSNTSLMGVSNTVRAHVCRTHRDARSSSRRKPSRS